MFFVVVLVGLTFSIIRAKFIANMLFIVFPQRTLLLASLIGTLVIITTLPLTIKIPGMYDPLYINNFMGRTELFTPTWFLSASGVLVASSISFAFGGIAERSILVWKGLPTNSASQIAWYSSISLYITIVALIAFMMMYADMNF